MTQVSQEVSKDAKHCSACRTDLPLSAFAKNQDSRDGLQSVCKSCRAQKAAAYREKHRETLREKSRLYSEQNRERLRTKNRSYAIKYRKDNPEKVKQCTKLWRACHREHLQKYERERVRTTAQKEQRRRYMGRYYAAHKRRLISAIQARAQRKKHEPEFVIMRRIRSRAGAILRRRAGGSGSKRASRMLGCTATELVVYIESLFLPGMTWDNRNEWSIDHVRPLASFDLTDPEQQRQACHYTNLQPLWHWMNLRKGDRWGVPAFA